MASKRGRYLLIVLFLGLLGVTLTGALIGNEVSTKLGDRFVWAESAHALSGAHVSMEPAGAVFQLGEQRITVTQDAVLLPDGRRLPVPAACRRIALSETSEGVRVRMDDVPAN